MNFVSGEMMITNELYLFTHSQRPIEFSCIFFFLQKLSKINGKKKLNTKQKLTLIF